MLVKDAVIQGPSRTERPRLLWKTMQMLLRIGTTLLFDLKVYGRENVPRTGGVLLVTNHQSNLDPVLLGVQLYRPISYLAKEELFHNRFFGAFITRLYAFPVKPGGRGAGPLKESIRLLNEGRMLNIFTEGERSRDGRLLPSLPGAALVIRKTSVPVIPVVVDRTYRAWPRGAALFRPHPIKMLVGPRLEVEGLDAKAICAAIDKAFADLMEQLRGDRGVANG